MITAEQYEKAVGAQPENDDLERCNCSLVGEMGHSSCGWCGDHEKPRAICGCLRFYWLHDDEQQL